MKIAVILCTFNRCQSLARALESLGACYMPPSVQWKVLVVDNNSTDATRSVVEDFARRFQGRFEYLFQPRQGKSNALNLGVEKTTEEILAFVDDDVQVDPRWLMRLSAVFTNPEWSGAGGRIAPEAEFEAPVWLDTTGPYALAPLAMFDPGRPSGNLPEPPFGANMAYRRVMFSKHGGFRRDLGPQPGGEIKNEDVEFGARLLAAGERLCYVPEAVVYHDIPRHRVTKKYFRNWWLGKGRSEIRQVGTTDGSRFRVMGVPLVFLRRMMLWGLRWMFETRPSGRFSCQLRIWQIAGQVQECYASNRKHEPMPATQVSRYP